MESETTPQTLDSNKSRIQTFVAFAALIGVVIVTFLFIRNLNDEHNPPLTATSTATSSKAAVPFEGRYTVISDGTWQLTRYTDQDGTSTAPGEYHFHFSNNTLSVKMCNILAAPYSIKGDPPEIRFKLLQRSKMLCSDAVMRPENALTSSLRGGLDVDLSKDQQKLILTGDSTGYRFEFIRIK